MYENYLRLSSAGNRIACTVILFGGMLYTYAIHRQHPALETMNAFQAKYLFDGWYYSELNVWAFFFVVGALAYVAGLAWDYGMRDGRFRENGDS